MNKIYFDTLRTKFFYKNIVNRLYISNYILTGFKNADLLCRRLIKTTSGCDCYLTTLKSSIIFITNVQLNKIERNKTTKQNTQSYFCT